MIYWIGKSKREKRRQRTMIYIPSSTLVWSGLDWVGSVRGKVPSSIL
jgi:hypothetical protein